MARHLYGDPMKCTGCRICELVCSFNKDKALNPGKARLRIEKLESGEDRVHSCRQCEHAPCIDACPNHAIYREDGVVKIDETKCTGIFRCVDACPFGVIVKVPELKKAFKCDLCGECVRFCPPEALVIADPMEIARRKREELMERGCNLSCR